VEEDQFYLISASKGTSHSAKHLRDMLMRT
jgi:hypothetical protein